MTKLARWIATGSVVLALCMAGSLTAQTNATPAPAPKSAQKVAPKPDAKTAAPSPAAAKPAQAPAPKPGAKPVAMGKTTAEAPAPKPAPKEVAAGKAPAPKSAPKEVAGAKPMPKPATKPAAPAAVAAKPAADIKPGAVEQPKQSGATASPDQAPTVAEEPAGPRRDPFVALVNDRKESGPNLPPGKAGLVVSTVRVDGTVRSGNEMIAVLSNPERHVYFVRQGDQLYDGNVERIDLDGVTFHEDSKDAFGKPIIRTVTKRIYASAGEQQ